VLLAWSVSGVLTLFGALACAELASAFPRTGGVYVFLKETYAPVAGFLWGWAMFWVMHSGIIAAMATVFGRYAGFFVPLGDRGIRAVAVSAILGISALNYVGVKRGSAVQTAFTAAKVAGVALIVVVGFAVGSRLPDHFQQDASTAAHAIGPHGFLLALIAGLFAFGGWHVVTYTAEETVQPERTIPRALALGIVIVTSCYVALNAVYFYVLPLERVEKSTRVAADVATTLLGAGGATSVFRDGTRRDDFSLDGRHPPPIPHTASSDRAPGDLGVGARLVGHLSPALYTRHLHRMDLLRADGGRHLPAAPAARLRAGLSSLGISVGAGGVRRRVGDHRDQPADLRTA